jgi:hypothetical protein
MACYKSVSDLGNNFGICLFKRMMLFFVDVQILRGEYSFVIVCGLWLLILFYTLFISFLVFIGCDVIFCALVLLWLTSVKNFQSILLLSCLASYVSFQLCPFHCTARYKLWNSFVLLLPDFGPDQTSLKSKLQLRLLARLQNSEVKELYV